MRYFALCMMLLSLCLFATGCPGDRAPAPQPSPVIEEEGDPAVDTYDGDRPVDPVDDPVDDPMEPAEPVIE